MALYQYRCRLCECAFELRRTEDERNKAAFCECCDVWSGRRELTAPAIRGETVAWRQ